MPDPTSSPAALDADPALLGTGIIPPLVTPWSADHSLDEPGLERLVNKLIDAGVHGLFVLGTTGEGPALDAATQRRVVYVAVAASGGRVPVYVGVTDSSLARLHRLADHAADAGAAAVVVAPPPYSPAAPPELNQYLDAVHEALPLPMFLYNIPSRTGGLTLDSVRHAMTLDRCVGFKDSSGDMLFVHRVLRLRDERRPGFRVLMGPEELLAEAVLFGADGGVAGGGNLFPELFVRLYHAARRGDLDTARRLHRTIIHLSSTLYQAGQYGSSFIKTVKHGLMRQGICDSHMVPPYAAYLPADRPRVDDLFDQAAATVVSTLKDPAQP